MYLYLFSYILKPLNQSGLVLPGLHDGDEVIGENARGRLAGEHLLWQGVLQTGVMVHVLQYRSLSFKSIKTYVYWKFLSSSNWGHGTLPTINITFM